MRFLKRESVEVRGDEAEMTLNAMRFPTQQFV
jgi:hypothetical protein